MHLFKLYYWREIPFEYLLDGEVEKKYGLLNIYVPKDKVDANSPLLYECILVKWNLKNPNIMGANCTYFQIIANHIYEKILMPLH